MAKVVGVKFRKAGKIYYFSPGKFDIKKGDNVIVETARGVEYGLISIGVKEVTEDEIVSPLKDVVRIANAEDDKKNEDNIKKEIDAFDICLEKINKHKLDMKLIDIEYTFDNNKILFYFTADGRIDFRELVKDLASVFRTRIELRQIGVRDEAKLMGGIGICGRALCCSTFLGDFNPVSIKMAKEQGLSLNPSKISGICGRLMCCLKYEHETYEELIKKIPFIGSEVMTSDGKGVVVGVELLKEKVKVKLWKKDEIDIRVYDVEDIKTIKKTSIVDSLKVEDVDEKQLKQLED